ncbi:MAG: hypothetical protein HWQ43_32565 [Nostoc sp. JL31]|uniref:hypothetical protein n=1 Tax=Nostoc sp. JL31 TaxID=2815395 RepID=UPI0025CCDD59|nr:hypothetical protein [Nostoc sp. JL31]MBN3893649.1 hypothetical protein [Nostoc sp. JL31]
MKVQQLIEKLQSFPSDSPIVIRDIVDDFPLLLFDLRLENNIVKVIVGDDKSEEMEKDIYAD